MIGAPPGCILLHRRVARAAGLSVAVATMVCAASVAHALPPLSARFEARFEATSTLHAFEGTASPARAELEPVDGSTDAAPLLRGEAVVPVATLTTGNDRRDTKMRTMFGADQHPMIRASFPRIDVRRLRTSVAAGHGELPLRLTMRGVTREVVASVSRWEETADHASFDARFQVSLEQFGLEPPSVFGLIRVGDQVDVTVEAVVAPR